MELKYPERHPPDRPLLTLIVATLDRPAEVLGLLESIPPAAQGSLDIVIVDQAADRALEAALAEAGVLASLCYVRSAVQNASHARNRGAALARTPWLCFPDDDACLLPGTLDAALPLLSGATAALVAGNIVDEQGRPHLLSWLEHEAALTPATIDRCFVESAFFIRRELFEEVGGFDPAFGPGSVFPSAEGADLVRRLWQRHPGLPAIYTPRISLVHPAKGQHASQESWDRVHRFAVGEGAFTARHYRQLALFPVLRRVAGRAAVSSLSRGHERRRRLAYVRGFLEGVRRYRTQSAPVWRRKAGTELPGGNEMAHTAGRPTLSLVIATCGRSTELRRCLSTLQNFGGEVEILVVDQNADDRVERVLAGVAGELRVTHLRLARRCASLARNLGAAHARGRWLAFPDDDCWYRPETLRRVLARIVQERADLVSGILLAPDGRPAILRWPARECTITPGRVRRTATECTVFLRRELFLSVGGFDAAFGPGSHFAAEEGVDLLRRLHRHRPAMRMVFSPEIQLHHERPSPFQDEAALRKSIAYCHARGACAARHRRLASLPRVAVEILKTLLGSLLLRGLARQGRLRGLLAFGRGFVDYTRGSRVRAEAEPVRQSVC